MKIIFIFFLFLISNFLFSQEIYQNKDVYFDNNIAYKVSDNKTISGIVEFRDNKNIIFLKKEFLNGTLIKLFEYYNVRKMNFREVVAREIEYKNGKIISKIFYRSTGEKFGYIAYDESGKKKLEEYYKNGVLESSTNYKNGKKDGIMICHDKEGNLLQFVYKEGKLIN